MKLYRCPNGFAHQDYLTEHSRFLEDELRQGEVLVSPAGGFAAKCNLIVEAEIQRPDLTRPEYFADEIVTISQWHRGKHYYISRNRSRHFVPEKSDTYQAAEMAALKYVPAGRIKARC